MIIHWDFGTTRTLKDHLLAAIPSGTNVSFTVDDRVNNVTQSYSADWQFSNSAGVPDVNGSGTNFSSDDGIWGAGAGVLQGNCGGCNAAMEYGIANCDSGDSTCNRVWVNGTYTSQSDVRSYIYMK